jgi:hypothetical protein
MGIRSISEYYIFEVAKNANQDAPETDAKRDYGGLDTSVSARADDGEGCLVGWQRKRTTGMSWNSKMRKM